MSESAGSEKRVTLGQTWAFKTPEAHLAVTTSPIMWVCGNHFHSNHRTSIYWNLFIWSSDSSHFFHIVSLVVGPQKQNYCTSVLIFANYCLGYVLFFFSPMIVYVVKPFEFLPARIVEERFVVSSWDGFVMDRVVYSFVYLKAFAIQVGTFLLIVLWHERCVFILDRLTLVALAGLNSMCSPNLSLNFLCSGVWAVCCQLLYLA